MSYALRLNNTVVHSAVTFLYSLISPEGNQSTPARFWRSESVKDRKTDTTTNRNTSIRWKFAAE